MKAAKIAQIIQISRKENEKADRDYHAAQMTLLRGAQGALAKRAVDLGLSLAAIKPATTIKAAQAQLLVIRGQFLTLLAKAGLDLDGIAVDSLAMNNTMILRSLDLNFRSQPQNVSIFRQSSMTGKQFQDSVGRRIAKIREGKKSSQERLAKATGTTSATIARMENGKQRISITKLYAIAEALDVSPYVLLVGPMPPPPPVTEELLDQVQAKIDQQRAKLRADRKVAKE